MTNDDHGHDHEHDHHHGHAGDDLLAAKPILTVASVPESLAFYVDKLGFTCAYAWSDSQQFDAPTEPTFAEVQRGGVSLMLSQRAPPALANADDTVGSPVGTGSTAGPAPGSPAGPAPGSPAGPAPGSPAGPAPGSPAGPAPGSPAGGMWVYVDVHGLAALAALHTQAQANGALIAEPPTDKPWGMREMLLRDPDGHTLRCGASMSHP